jgi:hypothetical protein
LCVAEMLELYSLAHLSSTSFDNFGDVLPHIFKTILYISITLYRSFIIVT